MAYAPLKKYETALKPLNILIRCDASVEIGLGHVTRCLVLANELKEKGHNVYFALKKFELGINKVSEQGFQYFLPSSPFIYHQWITDLSTQLNINVFIGDVRDGLTIATIEQLKANNTLTVAIDEPSDYRKVCDLCFYPPHAQLDKLDWKGFTGEIKQGLEYVILRPEFYYDYPYQKQKKSNNILIMMGGTDPKRLTLLLINQLLNTNLKINIIVIISRSHPDFEEIIKKPVIIHSNITNMPLLLTTIHYAIISFGICAYELSALKVPATHICLNQDHILASQYFHKHNLALTLPCQLLTKTTNLVDFSLSIEKYKIKPCRIVEKMINKANSQNKLVIHNECQKVTKDK